jgi:hypothetical protein
MKKQLIAAALVAVIATPVHADRAREAVIDSMVDCMDALIGGYMHKDAIAQIEEKGGMEQMLEDMKAAAAMHQIDMKTDVGPLIGRRQVERRVAMETANGLDELTDILTRAMSGSFSCTHFSAYRN